MSTLERKLADLQAELEVKDHLLETAKINTNDGHQTERNTPNSAKLSNSSKQCRTAGPVCPLHFLARPAVSCHGLGIDGKPFGGTHAWRHRQLVVSSLEPIEKVLVKNGSQVVSCGRS